MSFKLSKYQQDIINFIKNTDESLTIKATAGSGKTTILLECMKYIDTYNALFLAFNRSIAEELRYRVPQNFQARTFHSVCFEAWREFCDGRRIAVNEDKVWGIIWDLLGQEGVYTYGYFIKNLVALAKNAGIGTDLYVDNLSSWKALIDHHDLRLGSAKADTTLAILYARKVLNISSSKRYLIDFDDMLYMPLLYGASFRRYDAIFVDEAQDLSVIQHTLLEAMLNAKGRLVAVGDPHQAIYGFRGADSESMGKLEDSFGCHSLPLSITYRCDKQIVKHANRWVPHLEAAKYAAEGVVDYLDFYTEKEFEDGDVIICRNTGPLVEMAYAFLRRNRRVKILGRDIGEGLIILIEKFKTDDIEELRGKLDSWHRREMERARSKNNENKMISVDDKYSCISIFIDNLDEDHRTVDDLCFNIARLFQETDEDILTLCTGHKSKGLEWDRVFWLEKGLIPSSYATKAWMLRQEDNLAYVITTRAKHHLTFINLHTWKNSPINKIKKVEVSNV